MSGVFGSYISDWMRADYWTTQDGRRIYPHQFSHSHLLNTIGHIERRISPVRCDMEFLDGLELIRSLAAINADDGMKHAATEELLYKERQTLRHWLYDTIPVYKLLVDEAISRGILSGNIKGSENFLDKTSNPHYLAIKAYYGDKCAERSKVHYMSHIDEGLRILDAIGASLAAKEAYCLHPIYQLHSEPTKYVDETTLRSRSIYLVLEYKRVANSYLSYKYRSEADEVPLSSEEEVNTMLVANKVQNRKDFELYHKGTHSKSDLLDGYFKNWLRALNIDESEYDHLKSIITNN